MLNSSSTIIVNLSRFLHKPGHCGQYHMKYYQLQKNRTKNIVNKLVASLVMDELPHEDLDRILVFLCAVSISLTGPALQCKGHVSNSKYMHICKIN